METLFWFSFVAIFYIYLGYPIYVFLLAKTMGNAVHKNSMYEPQVSVVMSVYNEGNNIENKVYNLLESQYPKDKIEILIGSDGSNDSTNDIIKNLSGENTHIFIFQKRRGKPGVLNDLVKNAKGDIIVFCDARQIFDPDAIRHLVSNFSDDSVGCVSGELVFKGDGADNSVTEGVGIYWSYEKFIRENESRIYSMAGATGAIYAIRKSLYSALPENTILDDVYIPLSIARKGYRCVMDSSAKAYDTPSIAPQEEYRRKTRTLAGNYQLFSMFRGLFIPFKSRLAMSLFSHKFLRVISPFFLIALFLSNIFMAKTSYYGAFLIAQAAFYVAAMMGRVTYNSSRQKPHFFKKLAGVIYMFCLMNYSALVGLYRYMFCRQNIAWDK